MSNSQPARTRRRQLGEAAVVVGFLALAALVFHQTRTSFVEQGAAGGGAMFNAAMFPELCGWALLLLAVIRVGAIIRALAVSGALAEDEGEPVEWSNRRRALVCTGYFIAYLILLKPLGYHLTTPVFMFACFYTLGTRNVPLSAALAVVTSLAMSFIFEYLMRVIFPVGMFGIGF